MHIADAIELHLAHHEMPRERIACAWTTQLEQSQEGQLSAGGPGSGRKPQEVLEQNGWKKDGYHFKYGWDYRNQSAPRHYITVRPNQQNWQHNDGSTVIKRGNGADKLEEHLKGFHGK